jgi:hypothetical protein
MVGVYYMIRDLLVSGAALLGAALWQLGPRVNFMSAAAIGAVGTIFYVVTLRAGGDAARATR